MNLKSSAGEVGGGVSVVCYSFPHLFILPSVYLFISFHTETLEPSRRFLLISVTKAAFIKI